MAYLNATVLNDYQAREAVNEKRFAAHGVIDLVYNSSPFCDFITPSTREKMATISGAQAIKLPAIQDQTVTVVTTPGFTFIPDNLTTSVEYTFVAYDIFSGFRQYDASYANNNVDRDFDRDTKIKNVLNAMADTKEGILTTVLDAQRAQTLDYTAQVNQSSGGGTYTFTGGDILTVNKAAQQETMFSSLSALMIANKLDGSYATVTSPAGLAVQKMEALKYGANNEKDVQALGMIPASDMHTSHNISTSAVFDGYWVQKGAIGMFSNFPYDFRNGTEVDSAKWSVTDVEMPMVKSRLNVYTDRFKANATNIVSSADTNVIMSAGEEMAMWDRFYVVYPYNSDLSVYPSGIVKIQGLTS
tara:strand:+ start:367 stop:1440 length:1074 start_codon:yes stop_codon:yes gene_type:complete